MRQLILLVLLAALPARAQEWVESSRLPQTFETPLAADPMQVTVHRLSNGLSVYLSPNPELPRVTAWIAVRAGSKHDPADSTGMAHYLEHMLFKGTRRLGTLDFDKEKPHLDRILELYERLFKAQDAEERRRIYKEIDKENLEASRYAVPNEMDKAYKTLGVRGVNAFTSNEQTVYVCDLPKNRLEAWARLEADRFANAVFRLFQTEIETVYEEKNRSMDNPSRIIEEALDKQLFQDHPYGRTVLGSVEHLKNPSLAKMYEFHSRYYAPNNMAIALAGDFDRKEALAVIERHFGAWAPKPLPPPEAGAPPKPKGPERVEVRYEAEEQVVLAWPTVPESHPDAEALAVMDMVMDNAEAGIVNLYLNQGQRVKSAGSYPEFLNEGGVWRIWGVPKEGQTLEQVEALLLETVAKLKAGEFSEADLKAIITNFEIAEKRKLESNEARVAAMVDAFVSYEEWPWAAARLDRMRKVTKDDVLRVAKRYLGDSRVAALRRKGKPQIPAIVKPDFTKIPIDASRKSAFYDEIVRMPAPPVEPRWLKQGEDYRVERVRAGTVYSAKNPVNDLFQLSFRFDRGRKHARNLCSALQLLDLSGAGDMPAEDFKRRLFALGTSMSVGCGEQESGVTLEGLEANLEESLRLMRLRFESPHIASGTLERMVLIEIGAHKDNKVDPGAVHGALSEFAQYGRESAVLGELTDEELRKLSEADLVSLLRGYLDYESRIAYVGAREPAQLAALVQVEGKEYKPAPPYRHKLLTRPQGPRVLFTHRDMVQSRVGAFAADEVYDPQSHVDYQYYGAYMGGGMSAVIFQEIREARSLAYAAGGGYATADRKGGENRVWGGLGCQADKTLEASELLLKLLRDMPASEERFVETREAVEQAYRTSPVQFRAIPGTVIHWRLLGIEEDDPRPARMKRALKYKLADLVRFAARFRDRPMTLHILGNRERVDLEAFSALGPVEEKKIDELFPY